ncbi:MAG TPA: HAMP domain-containing sensor histidine kinase [Candidatus Saccharimonadales bacterium]|nr:HAMP domain-containing sensor histidine kinase [Candidatus Saccharimonadales bacterium]
MYKSATITLTAWYLALVMAISVIFSGVVYHFATDTLATGLSRQEARIYREFPVFSGNPFFMRDTDVETGAHHILLNLVYFNIVVLVAAGFASYWLARRTLRPIEASNERQKRFVADASHELRTPLTALKMSSEVALLDDAASKDDLRAALRSNVEEADKLDQLLNHLLRLSQLESSTLQHSFTQLRGGELAAEAAAQVQPRATAKHITIQNEVEPAADRPVYGDRDSLVQVLVILLDNAVKYSPEHTAVTLAATSHIHTTTFTVADHGTGIEPAALEHVFDRFYRADKARSGQQGFGLGLSIAKHIADVHHGTITLTSTVGKGTKASFTLPATANAAADIRR